MAAFLQWQLLLVLGVVLAGVLLIHFSLARPLKLQTEEALERSREVSRRLRLHSVLATTTSACLRGLALNQPSEAGSSAVAVLRSQEHYLQAYPRLQQTTAELAQAMSDFEAALRSGTEQDRSELRSRVATACQDVERELSNLVPSH